MVRAGPPGHRLMVGRLLAYWARHRAARLRASPPLATPEVKAAPLTGLQGWIATDPYPAYESALLCADSLRQQAATALAAGIDLAFAQQNLQQLIERAPSAVIDRMLFAEVLLVQGQSERGCAALREVADNPGRIGARAAVVLAEQAYCAGHFVQAAQYIGRAARDASDSMACQIMLGRICDIQGLHAKALEHFRLAVAAQPTVVVTRVYVATALICMGELAAGLTEWVEAETRGGLYRFEAACPVWDGQPLEDARLLILTHSGFGDVIQFIRFARHLRARAPRARLSVLVRPALASLMRASGLFEAVHSGQVDSQDADWQITQTHLPLVLGLQMRDLQGFSSYLQAPAPLAQAAASWLPSREPGCLRVGLRWAGAPGPFDAKRSVPLALLKSWFDIPGVQWVGLAEDRASAGAAAHEFGVLDVSAHLGDFCATAALMGQLDLIISVDTSCAHLAGALNLPTWLIAPPDADWRWGRTGPATPWYGSVRVFRHPPGADLDWPVVVREIEAALRSRLALPG